MKIRELLESQENWENISESGRQVLFSKINRNVIEVLQGQNNIDLPSFMQKLANILSKNKQQDLVSILNYLIQNDLIKLPIDDLNKIQNEKEKSELSKKLSTQLVEGAKEERIVEEKIKQSIVTNSEELAGKNLNIELNNLSDQLVANALKAIQDLNSNPVPTGDDIFRIDEFSGSALGITLGRTSKSEVLSMLKKYSPNSTNANNMGKKFVYDDLSLTIVFNDQKIVKGLTFGKNYKGLTSKGIKVGDKMDLAIYLYGEPQYKTAYSCVWQEMAVFCDEPNIISSIRLQI